MSLSLIPEELVEQMRRQKTDEQGRIDAELSEKLKNLVLVDTGSPRIDAFVKEIFETMKSKGHDYREGNDHDLLHNFRTVGQDCGLSMEQVWYVYTSKHWKALKTYIKEKGQSESEPIESRIKDIIVYLLLFYEMVQQQKPQKFAPVTTTPPAAPRSLLKELAEFEKNYKKPNTVLELEQFGGKMDCAKDWYGPQQLSLDLGPRLGSD